MGDASCGKGGHGVLLSKYPQPRRRRFPTMTQTWRGDPHYLGHLQLPWNSRPLKKRHSLVSFHGTLSLCHENVDVPDSEMNLTATIFFLKKYTQTKLNDAMTSKISNYLNDCFTSSCQIISEICMMGIGSQMVPERPGYVGTGVEPRWRNMWRGK